MLRLLNNSVKKTFGNIRILNTNSVITNNSKIIQNYVTPSSSKYFHSNSNTFQQDKRLFDINTNLAKDVILFKYENPRFYKLVNIFGVCQYIFWSWLSYFSFTTLRDAPVERNKDPDLAWWRKINLGDNKYRNSITAFCFIIGFGILGAAWTFTLRSVRFLILRKGGKDVTLVTYTPFGNNRMMTVPLKFISAQESRETAGVQLPIKVKNKAFYYILDMKGEFTNTRLFDYSVALKRSF